MNKKNNNNKISTYIVNKREQNTNNAGCTDQTAFNYDPFATQNDGSCKFAVDGVVEYTVTVAVDENSDLKYYIDGNLTPELTLQRNITYRFNQSDSSNNTHPLRFYESEDKSSGEFSTGVSVDTQNSYIDITIDNTTPNILYYQCSSHLNMGARINVVALSLKGIIDFTVPTGGSDGKAIHLVATAYIPDLSVFGIGVAQNGGGTNGQEYTFPASSAYSGDNILVARSQTAMENYFGDCINNFDKLFEDDDGGLTQNGDDAIELFQNGTVIETFGDINTDGSGQTWDYLDSWAYKDDEDGSWTYGGVNCTDGSTTTQESSCPYPLCLAIAGCIDPTASNYDPSATQDDGSCTYSVTFSVDTSNITVGDNGMYVGGGMLGDAQAYQMTDPDGDGIYSVTIELNDGGNYIFLNSPNGGGDWGTKEILAGLECSDPNNFNDRILETVTSNIELDVQCFGGCGECFVYTPLIISGPTGVATIPKSVKIFGEDVELIDNKGFLSEPFILTFNLENLYIINGFIGVEATTSAYVAQLGLNQNTPQNDVYTALLTSLDNTYGTSNTNITAVTIPYNDPEHYLLEIDLPAGTKPKYQGVDRSGATDVTWRLSYCSTAGDSSTVYSTVLSGNMSGSTLQISPDVENVSIWYPVNGPSGQPPSGIRLNDIYSFSVYNSSVSISENTTDVYTFTANESVIWSLNGGADESKFTINSNTGALSFISAPNFENPTDADTDNSYIVTVRATDNSGNTSDHTVAVTVIDELDQKPYIVSSTKASIMEYSGPNQIIYKAFAKDLDSDISDLTFYIDYTDEFTINKYTGEVTLIPNPVYEIKSEYTFNVYAKDKDGNTGYTKTVTLNITPANVTLKQPDKNGLPQEDIIIPVEKGWNLIGTTSANILLNNNLIVSNSLYMFEETYIPIDYSQSHKGYPLEANTGYWIKCDW